jgi:hypothetical protein
MLKPYCSRARGSSLYRLRTVEVMKSRSGVGEKSLNAGLTARRTAGRGKSTSAPLGEGMSVCPEVPGHHARESERLDELIVRCGPSARRPAPSRRLQIRHAPLVQQDPQALVRDALDRPGRPGTRPAFGRLPDENGSCSARRFRRSWWSAAARGGTSAADGLARPQRVEAVGGGGCAACRGRGPGW